MPYLTDNPWKKLFAGFMMAALIVTVLTFVFLIHQGLLVWKPGPPPEERVTVNRYGTLNPELFQEYIQAANPKIYPRMAEELVDAIFSASRKYRIPPVMIAALMQTESEFFPFAISKTGARGPLQVQLNIWMESLIKEGILKNENEIFDPFIGTEAGAFILRHYADETKDMSLALNKYLGDDHAPYREKVAKYIGNIVEMGIVRETNAAYSLK